MQLFHTVSRSSAAFDESSLVSAAGLVPVLALAERARLRQLADERLTVPTDRGAHAGSKVSSLVAGMVADADSIEDMSLLRHGGMGRLFHDCYAPSTLGSFLRMVRFGHVRQLDAVTPDARSDYLSGRLHRAHRSQRPARVGEPGATNS